MNGMPHVGRSILLLILLASVSAGQGYGSGAAAGNGVGGQFGGLGGTGFGPGGPANIVTVEAEWVPPQGSQPGGIAVRANMAPGWHIYSISMPSGGPIPSQIALTPPQGIRIGAFRALTPPVRKVEPLFDNMTIEYHEGAITWVAPLEVAPGVNAAGLPISGVLTVQACDANQCLPPSGYAFVAQPVASAAWLGALSGVAPAATVPAPTPALAPPTAESMGSAAAAPEDAAARAPNSLTLDPSALRAAANDVQRRSLGEILLYAFLGGLILNIMPCVFPVIGLKVMSFVEQAGHDRAKAFWLNLWYMFGILLVFWVLAGLAVGLGWGWGEAFTYSGFGITMAAIVFVMGLGFLGVWEIPIPGFVGRGSVVDAADREGIAGAVTKGALTTILATPCSAPFLGTAITFTFHQPPLIVFLSFTAMGLGLASPYVVLGAFPELLRFLPRPGAWMDTFKQMMGFVLMGTVIFLLTFISAPLVVPTVALMFGLWAACWWIGQTPFDAPASTKLVRWLQAGAMAAIVIVFAFVGTPALQRLGVPAVSSLASVMESRLADAYGDSGHRFTRARFDSLIAARQTVLVDFTADWCLTCKVLEATVLNSQAVRDALAANRVVTLKADWTHQPPEVTELLTLLGAKQVPVLAIFPAGNPNQPIAFIGGGYTQAQVVAAIERAGPSQLMPGQPSESPAQLSSAALSAGQSR